MTDLTGPLVVAVLYDGLCTFEFGIVAEIFGLSRPELGRNWYRFASCSIENGPLKAHGGFHIYPEHGPELLDEADIIVIAGWKGTDVEVPQALIDKLLAAHSRGARLASICSGAFVLASTGLLSGASAATHWRYAAKLQAQYPDIHVDDASLYRHSDRIFTSAGSAAGIDLMIEIVRQDYGAAAANSVARRLVMPAHRSGGQAQFLERPVPIRQGTEITPILEAVRKDLKASWNLIRMATEARMSLRTFIRRFTEATGQTPGDWLIAERVEEAKRLLCQIDTGTDEIAHAVGFGSTETLRHHFRKKIGISPGEYRARFRAKDRASLSA